MFAYDGSSESRKNLTRLTVSPLLHGLSCHIVMVNDTSALQDAQAVQEAGITTETRLLEDESVTGAPWRYADAHDIDLTVMGPAGTSVTAILYWHLKRSLKIKYGLILSHTARRESII